MSRISSRFAELKKQGRAALIPYLTAGDPDIEISLGVMHAMADAGADLIEVGIPFSDPMADGPIIQAACERALKSGTRLIDVLNLVRKFRSTNQETPVVLMGYVNPIEIMGYTTFATVAKECGVDGVLLVDLPPEEGEAICKELESRDIDRICLLSPTSSAARIKHICSESSGFVYYVSLKGVTGAASLDISLLRNRIENIRELCTKPVGVGFGIKDAESAAQVARVADAIVIGSVIVSTIHEHSVDVDSAKNAISVLIQEFRSAMDTVCAAA